MALETHYAYMQSDDGESIYIYNVTGIYSGANQTGYGAPNPLVTDMVSCTATVYAIDPTTLLSTTVLAVVDMYPTQPNIIGSPFVLSSTAVFGAPQNFGLGWLRIVVEEGTSTDPPTTYTYDYTFPVIQQVSCCIDNLIADAALCGCHDKDYIKLLLARAMLDQLSVCCTRSDGTVSNIEACGLINKGAEMMLYAKSICDSGNCNPCADC